MDMNTQLPSIWTFYLYNKYAFKKIVKNSGFSTKPYVDMAELSTLNDLVYLLQLMEVKHPDGRLNLEINDSVIMRKGIEPIWEDPKNQNGGIFSIKVPHEKGYALWSLLVMYLLGGTLMEDQELENVNGISFNTVTENGKIYNLIKIWDGSPQRTRDSFVNLLPLDVLKMIKGESMIYQSINQKRDFNKEFIIHKIKNVNRQNGFKR